MNESSCQCELCKSLTIAINDSVGIHNATNLRIWASFFNETFATPGRQEDAEEFLRELIHNCVNLSNLMHFNTKELRIDTYRAQGAGGQHVNKTDSAVRITHLPSGIVAQCQDEKSQHKNRTKAMKLLRSRLYDLERSEKDRERAAERKSQVGSGDRSERIRTYNFPQGRVTDHRVNLTLHKLDKVIEGELEEIVEALASSEQAKLLSEIES